MTNETRKHYIYDAALKAEREYAEDSGGKASVGDYVVNCGPDGTSEYYRVNGYCDEYLPSYTVEYDKDSPEDDVIAVSIAYSNKLTPTGNVRIAGELYALVERKAKRGDLVFHRDFDGESVTSNVIASGRASIGVDYYGINSVPHGDYRIIQPVEQPEPTQADPQGPRDETELLANLVRRVHELETENKKRRHDSYNHRLDIEELYKDTQNVVDKYEALVAEMDGIRRDLRTFAEVSEGAKQLAESNAQDIVTLDERTQPEELTRTVGRALRNYRRKGGCV